jgi:hypothetical protein
MIRSSKILAHSLCSSITLIPFRFVEQKLDHAQKQNFDDKQKVVNQK